jgi:predicted  nucleic acid-binding Zn-ribbon protein
MTTEQEKGEYQRKMRAQLDEWAADLDVLKAKAATASAEVKRDLTEQIHALEEQIQKGRKKLAELADSSDDAWDSIRGRLESTWSSLKSAIGDARSKLKKKL